MPFEVSFPSRVPRRDEPPYVGDGDTVPAQEVVAAPDPCRAEAEQLRRLEVGQPVSAIYPNGRWYPARIAEVREDGSYLVTWDDGDTRHREKTADQLTPRVPEQDKPATDAATRMVAEAQLAREAGWRPIEGDAVWALFPNGKWYPARIAEVWEDGTYVVNWDDGDNRHRERTLGQLAPRLQEVAGSLAAPALTEEQLARKAGWLPSVGEAVRAWYRNGRWYPASIAEVRADGTFLVTWDDGDVRDRSRTFDHLMPREPWPPVVGQAVKGRYPNGQWYRARVAEVNPDGTFLVNWDDGDAANRLLSDSQLSPADW